jgi:hypothetical protein
MSTLREKLTTLWEKIFLPEEDLTGKYPIHAKSRRIVLPSHIRSDLRDQLEEKYLEDAVEKVMAMTGATEEEATEYVERLGKSMDRRGYHR